MSLKLPASITTSSVFHQNYVSNQTQINKVNPFPSTTKGNHIILVHNPSNQINTAKTGEEEYDHCNNIKKRNLLLGLGTLFSTATVFTNQNLISIAALQHKMISGLKPLILEKKTVQVLVQRPKKLRSKSKKGNSTTEVLVVDGIEIHHDGPVKFDVYVAKAHNGVISSGLGEFAGSLVNMPFSRIGKDGIQVQGKGSLELGIGGLVRDIDAQDCDEIAVSLVPKLGEIKIDSIRIEGCRNSARDVDHIGALQPLKPHRTATFASLLNTAEMHLLS